MTFARHLASVNADTGAEGDTAAAFRAWIEAQNAVEADEPDPTVVEQAAAKYDPTDIDWAKIVNLNVVDALQSWEKNTGQVPGMAEHVFEQNAGDLFTDMAQRFIQGADERVGSHFIDINTSAEERAGTALELGSKYYTGTVEGVNEMIDWALNFMGARAGAQLARVPTGGGGGGRRGLSAADIRKQFDIEELARSVDEMNRELVFEPHQDAKRVARAYVEAVVRGKGEQKIDFRTYVESQIENTSRFKSIYRRKPEGVNARQHMAPYIQQARAAARPGDAAELAIGGAQFGATAEQFRARLGREDAVTGSAPFISSLEGRLQSLNSVLKG